jgi:hypothetical protein
MASARSSIFARSAGTNGNTGLCLAIYSSSCLSSSAFADGRLSSSY